MNTNTTKPVRKITRTKFAPKFSFFAERLEARQLLSAAPVALPPIVSVAWQGREIEAIRDSYVLRMPQTNVATARGLWDYQSAVPQVAAGWGVRSLGRGYFSIEAPGASVQDVDAWSLRVGALNLSPNKVYRRNATLTPNDPSYRSGALWGLDKIDAPEAWEKTTGSKDVVVVVMDDGIDHRHPDLQANLWFRDRAITKVPQNLQQEFRNRYGEFGWDSANNDDVVRPTTGSHGTHVAGTIGGVGDNRTGIVGVNWNVSIYAAKVFSDDGAFGTLAFRTEAVDRVVHLKTKYNQNVVAVNASFGYYGPAALQDHLDLANDLHSAGIMLIAAAGNGDADGVGDPNSKDGLGSYPASIDLPNVISVAASTPKDELTRFSNWGEVEIAAPGEGILSTVLADSRPPYGEKDGTSMAAPHVTGVVALVAADYQRWTKKTPSVNFLRQAILQGADTPESLKYTQTASDPSPGLVHSIEGNRRLNANGSLTWARRNLPPGVSVTQVTVPLQSEGDAGTKPLEFIASLSKLDLESGQYAPFTATEDITISYTTKKQEGLQPLPAGLEATEGVDFEAATGAFKIPKGKSEVRLQLVNVIGDNIAENNEQFRISLTGVSGGEAFLRSDLIFATIFDDDPTLLRPRVTLASSQVTVAEPLPGVQVATYFVTVNVNAGQGAPPKRPVVLGYEIIASGRSDSATPGIDFVAQSGRMIMPAGQAAGRIPFRIFSDTLQEGTETLLVRLTSAVPGLLVAGQSECLVSISDVATPSLPALSVVAPVPVTEGSGSNTQAIFEARLDTAAVSPVRVVYELVSATAKAGSDFLGRVGQAVIRPGETVAQIPVTIVGDRRHEEDETFVLRVKAVIGAELRGLADIAAQIRDDDAPVLNSPLALAGAFADFGSRPAGSLTLINGVSTNRQRRR